MNLFKTLALALVFASPLAQAGECELEIEGNDAMQFNLSEMEVSLSECPSLTVKLVHVGNLPVDVMGHNWVLTETANKDEVVDAGLPAGLENNYLPPDSDKVIAHTKVIGGGEEDSVTFDTSALTAGGDYTFFCSFPGHAAVMNGTFKVNE
ncbi:MAG: azurin [Gammaproteobacteria bacterium]|nr:MAG: azurin [Gammaproteobacteria bacterium]PIE37381.1 MAG: azurin [Gammaproteobacteria bacterium]